jgi:phosphatidylserine decarboxylase
MPVRREVVPFAAAAVALGALAGGAGALVGLAPTGAVSLAVAVALVLNGYLLFFFRDPPRHPPADPRAVVAGADGTILAIVDVHEPEFLKTDAVRLSIFLGLFDVHVNRAPIAGRVSFLGYYPGRRFFTFQEKSSTLNQHSSIVIQGARTTCLVNQIVGPVARRVVYWLETGQTLSVGERIGMMKFGSRLDMYFPRADVEILTRRGAAVRAGETVVARLRGAGPA